MKESKIFSSQNLTEKVHYVYRITIDGKYYIGKRTGLLSDLETGVYKTSSKLVREKLKNGITFSKIKILQVFSSSKEALVFESKILTRVNAKANPKFLNQSNGGDGDFSLRQHTEKTKEKMKERFNPETEQGRQNLEKRSKLSKAQFDPNTEEGRKRREKLSQISKSIFDINTEQGIKRREVQSNKRKEHFNPETEQGRRNLEKRSQISKSIFDKNTEEGRKRREKQSQSTKAHFDPNTEEGRKRRENHSEFMKEHFNPDSEEGRKQREKMSKSQKTRFDINTEYGRKQRENKSQSAKAQFDPNTEEGRKRRENHSKIIKEKAKEQLQKRQNASILGELMFDEAFIRENFLITDDKNNLRFLSSVYSKLSGYCDSQIRKQKRNGKLSFLHGINSISITEELENSKIEAIKAIIKNRNNEKE